GLAAPGEATLDLEHVFVNVGLSQSSPIPSTNPIPALKKNGRKKRYSIWQFLLPRAGNRPKNLVVLGAPGTGKTTLLKHLTLSLATPTQDAPRLNKTPILLYLRDIATQIRENPHYRLLHAVQSMLVERKVNLSLDWLVTEMANGRCLIMLDGLDEVADLELRQQVAAWVQRQMRQHYPNQFVITSRPFGYKSNPLPDTQKLEVKPFTIEQVTQFVNNWYLANELQKQGRNDVGVRRDAQLNAQDLLQRLNQTPALLEMGVNPLLLTMIATIHHYRGRLPDQRVALYHEICDVFLGRRQSARGIEFALTPSQKKRVLQTLAYEMMRRNLRNISQADAADIIDPALQRVHPQTRSADFLTMIANSSGLLVEHIAGVYSFAHLTFQEYLTAVQIKDQQLEKTLLDQVEESWWHETIRLYSAQTNATNIIRACVMRETASIPALTLAVECLDEALEVEDDFRKIPQELVRSIEDDNPEISRIGAEVLLQLRLRQLVRLDETTYADSSLVTQAEYQLFLNEMRGSGSYRQPDHWSDLQFTRGDGQTPIVGVRPSDAHAFCNWLTERESGPWRYRLPTAKEQSRPPLNTVAPTENDSMAGYWFLNGNSPKLAPAEELSDDVALVQALQRQIENRLLNDRLIMPQFGENDDATRLRTIILKRAKDRAYSLLDLERRLPFSGDKLAEIGRFFGRVQDRNAEGFATDMERSLINANAHIKNPNLTYARGTILEEIVEMGNQLLTSLDNLSFPQEITKLIRQLMRDLGRAREQITTAQQSLQSEFHSHRELVRHLNNALGIAQKLLDKLSRSRTDARVHLRINALRHGLELLRHHSESAAGKQKNLRLLTVLVDLYVDMAILESRSNNQMITLEGIRIIRESTPVS
ncbi:MAG: NACHT domain-containing protein, partial [Chloroflexi bacterium]|nr:NACHT domain-containing protein [Chloroflexota bacterium]